MKTKLLLGAALATAGLGWLLFTDSGRHAQFVLGGALINLGYRLQDHLESYDFEHHDEITPQQVWDEMVAQNGLAAAVRSRFPRTPRHPLVALVACMDARLDTNELTGDTRKYYYVIRTAGSALATKEQEMLELAVQNGIKVIVLTTHSDCAAERAAASPEQRQHYPMLAMAIDERDARIAELLARPAIAAKVAAGQLLVKRIDIDTLTEKMQPK